MKFKEYDEYRAYYCGLCSTLKEYYGLLGQLSLSYDMTFVVILLSSLYEPRIDNYYARCVTHPLRRHEFKSSEITRYVADMNMLLTYYKCQDDWDDEKKLSRKIYSDGISRRIKRISKLYEKKVTKITENLMKIKIAENNKCRDLDEIAGYFGEIFSEICVFKDDEWKEELSRMGFFLGKYIYILDAYDDLNNDMKKGLYNPFSEKSKDLDDYVKNLLTMVASDCSIEFEKLPLVENLDILRNIIYSGIWSGYARAREKRANYSK